MNPSKKDLFIIGIVIILGTRIFHFSNVFLIIGILLVFDALININNKSIED